MIIKITAKKIRPYVKIVLLTAVLIAAAYVFLFLRDYFYPAITGAQTISTLQKNMAISSVNLNQFEGIVNNIDKKTASGTTAAFVANPFK